MEKILKISAIVISVILVIGAVIFAVSAYNKFFPLAPEIRIPDGDDITEITIENSDGDNVTLGKEDALKLLKIMARCEPTRKWSVNDYPYVRPYYMITVYTSEDDRSYRYFIYEEDMELYLELPYQGVYSVEEEAMELLESYFE